MAELHDPCAQPEKADSGEAEAAQFEGEVEGTEQIGAALLFVEPEVDPETEDILGDVEKCLSDL